MERKNYPSLPSNYVTLAQLQERWLNQQNQINQPQSKPQPQHLDQEQKQQPPKEHHQQPRDQGVVAPTNGTDSRSRPQKQQYVVKNRNDSGTHRAVQVAYHDHRKLAASAGIGDETADLDEKVSESKKKKKKYTKVKQKPKTEERGARGDSSITEKQGNEEAEKAPMESELTEKKNGDSEVEQRVTVLPVEQGVRVLSINSGNGKQKEILGKMNNGFRHSQSQRKHYGEASYGKGKGKGNGQHLKVGVQGRETKMVWVRKDDVDGSFIKHL
ncbi:hypothetical protein CR513_37953, partial [Mucuna pruriens]